MNPSALGEPVVQRTGFTAASELADSVGYFWDWVQPDCAFHR
jgi:hypothetical protein